MTNTEQVEIELLGLNKESSAYKCIAALLTENKGMNRDIECLIESLNIAQVEAQELQAKLEFMTKQRDKLFNQLGKHDAACECYCCNPTV